ncbi:MAG TPA: hypothetical protein DD414_07435 [Lachnospiraceae bacterium]|nr:hypothetical protein [Lachnospiraceae bacterium]
MKKFIKTLTTVTAAALAVAGGIYAFRRFFNKDKDAEDEFDDEELFDDDFDEDEEETYEDAAAEDTEVKTDSAEASEEEADIFVEEDHTDSVSGEKEKED